MSPAHTELDVMLRRVTRASTFASTLLGVESVVTVVREGDAFVGTLRTTWSGTTSFADFRASTWLTAVSRAVAHAYTLRPRARG